MHSIGGFLPSMGEGISMDGRNPLSFVPYVSLLDSTLDGDAIHRK